MLNLIRFPNEIAKDIAKQEKIKRKKRKLTQAELSARAGISLASLKRFEQTGEISFVSLIKIAVVLDETEAFDQLFLTKEYSSIQEVIDEKNKCGDFFKRSFFDLVEKVILFLLQGQDAFFGHFMLRVKREIRFDIRVPIATIPKRDGFNLYFNPIFFLNCTKKEMAALLKHEIYHIMNLHFERERQLKNRFSKQAVGAALDISINQYIKDLPGYSRKLESINMEHNISLRENRSVEEYAEER